MRVLAVFSIIFLALGVTIVHATAYMVHPCAPAVPPVVSDATMPAQTSGIVLINEVLRTPGAKSAWECMSTINASPTDLWIELYNPQDQPFDLYAVRSSLDNGPQTGSFSLPFGAAIAPHGFLVLFPMTFLATQRTTEVMTLRLLMYDTVIDQVNIPPLSTDTSYARIPDGSATWSTTAYPTIDASNALAPILPTPTAKPIKKTPTPTASGQRNTTKPTSTVHTTRTGSTVQQAASPTSDIQPTWSTQHFSDQANTIASTLSPVASSSTPAFAPTQPTSAGLDFSTKILLTLMTVLLTFTAVWLWRLFFKT